MTPILILLFSSHQTQNETEVFNFSSVSCKDIKKHILAATSDAIGCDGLSRKMISLALDHILTVLSHILNYTLFSGTFPSSWRTAYVISIPKISNPSSSSHYHPISILPFLSKFLERIIYYQLSSHLSKHHILCPYQTGVRPSHSTTTALIKIFTNK